MFYFFSPKWSFIKRRGGYSCKQIFHLVKLTNQSFKNLYTCTNDVAVPLAQVQNATAGARVPACPPLLPSHAQCRLARDMGRAHVQLIQSHMDAQPGIAEKVESESREQNKDEVQGLL